MIIQFHLKKCNFYTKISTDKIELWIFSEFELFFCFKESEGLEAHALKTSVSQIIINAYCQNGSLDSFLSSVPIIFALGEFSTQLPGSAESWTFLLVNQHCCVHALVIIECSYEFILNSPSARNIFLILVENADWVVEQLLFCRILFSRFIQNSTLHPYTISICLYLWTFPLIPRGAPIQ